MLHITKKGLDNESQDMIINFSNSNGSFPCYFSFLYHWQDFGKLDYE